MASTATSRSELIPIGPYVFTTQDAQRTLANLGGLWARMLAGRDPAAALTIGDDLRRTLADAVGERTTADLDRDLARLGTVAGKRLGADRGPALADALAATWHALRSAADALRAAGQMPTTATGRVTQVSSSGGGVPKRDVGSAVVDFSGLNGDVQRSRVHHGRPWQALCLYSDEVLARLRAEGHSIDRGSAGENVTVAGLDWSEVRPGVLLRIGSVLAHVQAYAEPCAKNAQWFADGDFQRMNAERGPVSRVYATVLRPGTIATGDAVVLEPDVEGTIESSTHGG